MLIVIDNYDSFTFNLVQFLGEIGEELEVYRNDALSAASLLARGPSRVVLSPGPCTPDEAGECLNIVGACAEAGIPLLGVCLGHQTIGQHFGGRVVRAPVLMHGKTSFISHSGTGLFSGLNQPLRATRYHSLIVERSSLPQCLEINAETEDGLIMAMKHRDHPIWGVQFHPESLATENGIQLLRNFREMAQSVEKQTLEKE